MDKSAWAPGPWKREPDKAQWQDEATDLVCLVVRSHFSGALCGYVGLPEGHPLFGKSRDMAQGVEVHGCLTFHGFCREDRETGICHVPEPGKPDHVWWLGFDCAHAGIDACPGVAAMVEEALGRKSVLWGFGTYRTFAYVRRECRRLAVQLAAMKRPI